MNVISELVPKYVFFIQSQILQQTKLNLKDSFYNVLVTPIYFHTFVKVQLSEAANCADRGKSDPSRHSDT